MAISHARDSPEGDTPKTRLFARSALAGTAATPLALATGASAHADGLDRTVWAGADPNVTSRAGNPWHARSPAH
ncbi:hypothetical protein [Streptomyces sp. NRRL S-455]|uniref:hypothetical protein n=1 Tax=Streptomyces sp. NRRL S-455 TaxID=1463908 RepID=UPI0004BFF681|nr:hypothetical protein [Streptomyces sp. NRRL S-455]